MIEEIKLIVQKSKICYPFAVNGLNGETFIVFSVIITDNNLFIKCTSKKSKFNSVNLKNFSNYFIINLYKAIQENINNDIWED